MKRLLLLSSLLVVAVMVLRAEVRVNLGQLQLDTEYDLASFKNYIGTFTAPKSGILTCSATTNDVMYPYRWEMDNMFASGNAYDVSMNNLYGGRSYDFAVEEGVTYVMYASFIMNDGTTFRMTMADQASINFTGSSPAEGGIFNVSNGGQVVLDFDKSVAMSAAYLIAGEQKQRITGSVYVGSIQFDLKSQVWELLTSHVVSPGDEITLSLEGVSLASNRSVLYNGDGRLDLHFKLGAMPIQLVSTEHTNGDFLSFYTTTNPEGVVKLHFSGPVSADRLGAQLRYGSIDMDADGDYYVEALKPTLGDDGKTVIINLQGKRRRAIDMVASGTDFGQVILGVTGVMDTDGNYAYASGSGSLGSYWFSYGFKEITAEIFCEFTPASGATLSQSTPSIELWITDEAKLSYDGVLFTYQKGGAAHTCLVPNSQLQKEVDPDERTAAILTIPVPTEVLGATEITLTLANLQCADGSDYSATLSAHYTSNSADAIQSLTTAEDNLPMYQLNGQRAAQRRKGILVRRGQKVLY